MVVTGERCTTATSAYRPSGECLYCPIGMRRAMRRCDQYPAGPAELVAHRRAGFTAMLLAVVILGSGVHAGRDAWAQDHVPAPAAMVHPTDAGATCATGTAPREITDE